MIFSTTGAIQDPGIAMFESSNIVKDAWESYDGGQD